MGLYEPVKRESLIGMATLLDLDGLPGLERETEVEMLFTGRKVTYKSGIGKFRHTTKLSVGRSENGAIYKIETRRAHRKKQVFIIAPETAVVLDVILRDILQRSGDGERVAKTWETVK